MRQWIAFAVACCLMSVSLGVLAEGWRVNRKVDAMTDELKLSAVVASVEGNTFTVYRVAGGSVWGNFALADESPEVLAHDEPLMYRIDKNEPATVEPSSDLERQILGANEWEPKWVNFLIWHGKESEGRARSIKLLMTGSNLVVRYRLFTGGYKDTTFTLVGSGTAIATALGISVEPNAGIEATTEDNKRIVIDASNRCLQDRDNSAVCMEKLQKCVQQVAEAPEGLRRCLEGTE